MKPRIKNGLVAGLAGLAAGACLTFGVSGLCGPVVAILTGILAGHFTAREECPATRREGARLGAVSGGIAGALMLLIGLISVVDLPARIRATLVPAGTAGLSPDVTFSLIYASALVAAGGLAVANGLLAALAGAAAGYWYAPRPAEPASAVKPGAEPGTPSTLTLPLAGVTALPRPFVWRQGLRFGLTFGGTLSTVISFSVLNFGGANLNLGVWLVTSIAYFALAVGLFTLLGVAVVWVCRLAVGLLGQGAGR